MYFAVILEIFKSHNNFFYVYWDWPAALKVQKQFKVQVTRKIKFVLKDRFRQFKYFRKVSPPYAKWFYQLRWLNSLTKFE